VDNTPEVKRATALAAYPGTWLRDEVSYSHCRRAMAGGSQPFRPATCWRSMRLAY